MSSRPRSITPGRHAGGADGAEQQGVEAPPLLERPRREDRAVAQVAGAAEVVVDGVEGHAGGAHDLERLGDDLGTDPVASDDPDLVTQLCSRYRPLERKNRPPGWTVGRSAHGEPVRYTMMITAWTGRRHPGKCPPRAERGVKQVRSAAMRTPMTIGGHLDRAALVYGDRDRHRRRARCARRRPRRHHLPARCRSWRGPRRPALDERGIGRGERVAVLSQNSGRLLTSFFGVSGFGRVLVPINFRLSPAEIEYILEHSGASMLLVDPELAEAVAHLPVKHRVVLGTDTDGELFLEGREPEPWDEQDEDATATINYTSAAPPPGPRAWR